MSARIQIWTLFYMIWVRRDVILMTSRNDVNKTGGNMSFPANSHLLVTIRLFISLQIHLMAYGLNPVNQMIEQTWRTYANTLDKDLARRLSKYITYQMEKQYQLLLFEFSKFLCCMCFHTLVKEICPEISIHQGTCF